MNKINNPAQWAIKQHLAKFPKCEWLCLHTSLPNLGEVDERVPVKKLQPCNAVEHTVSDNGDSCLCGYFVTPKYISDKGV